MYLTGCGKTTDTIEMGDLAYVVPSGIAVTDDELGGISARMISAGEGKASGFVQWKDPKGATAQYASLGQKYAAVQNSVTELERKIRFDYSFVMGLSLVSMQTFKDPYVFSVAQYKLKTLTPMKPMDVAGSVAKSLSDGNVTGLPVADASAPEESDFRLFLLAGEFKGEVFYIAFVIPESLFSDYEVLANKVITGSRINEKGKTTASSDESFSQNKTGGGKADFLFVVDDSGSMSDNQDNLSKAASDFTSEMSNSGVKYRSAIITTSRDINDIASGNANRILNSVGIIENNDSLLEQELVAGSNGADTETGIWNAEQALQSKNLGDSIDGSITAKGMPASNTAMSVIILSDEPSQYTSRSTGGATFDTNSNLFTKRNIKVYAIINTSSPGQYADLAAKTGGIKSSIETNDFSAIMRQIAQDAGGAASSFVLPNPYVNISKVTVNSTDVPNDASNGWTANQAANSIVFHGSSVPASGAAIVVTYTYWK
jgi:hypothetical protein